MRDLPPVVRVPAGESLISIFDPVMLVSLARHELGGLRPVPEREKRLMRQVFEMIKPLPGQDVVVARWPIEHSDPYGPGEPERQIENVMMTMHRLGSLDLDASDESFVRAAAGAIRSLMEGRRRFFVYMIVRTGESWFIRCGWHGQLGGGR